MSKTTYDREDTSILIRRTQQVLFVNVHIFRKQKNGCEKDNIEMISPILFQLRRTAVRLSF